MSEAVQLATILSSFLTPIVAVVLAFFVNKWKNEQAERDAKAAELVAKVATQQEHATEAVREVKVELQNNTTDTNRQLAGLASVAMASHAFLNSEKRIVLEKSYGKSLRIFELTGKSEDKQIMEDDKAILDAHIQAQGVVDLQPGSDLQKQGKVLQGDEIEYKQSD